MDMREANLAILKDNINFNSGKKMTATGEITKKGPLTTKMNIIKRGMMIFIAVRLLPEVRY